MNPFADAVASPCADGLRALYSIKVMALPSGYAAKVRQAIDDGWLDAFITQGQIWVSESDLFDLVGPGADPFDPEGGCYLPSEARA